MAPGTKYYELLGIERTAGADEIKKAYRRLSLQWHPDKNPDNLAEAEERFKQVAEAYSVLSEPETRAIYDKYGEDGLRRGFQPPSAGAAAAGSSSSSSSAGGGGYGAYGPGGGFQFRSAHDIFRDFFGGQDPFAPMFAMGSMFGGHDPFAQAFFSAPTAAPMHGGFSSMFGGPASGGFGSLFGAGMPGVSSFSFVSSSAGGGGGFGALRGPSVTNSVQFINGVRMQTIEEHDGRGNVTVTRISPDGTKEVSVNGV
ncbi:DnaJ sub B member 2, partial [Coemansia javaensis]